MKKHVVLTHEDVKAENTEEHPDTVAPQENGKSSMENGLLKAYLPDKSFHMIVLGK